MKLFSDQFVIENSCKVIFKFKNLNSIYQVDITKLNYMKLIRENNFYQAIPNIYYLNDVKTSIACICNWDKISKHFLIQTQMNKNHLLHVIIVSPKTFQLSNQKNWAPIVTAFWQQEVSCCLFVVWICKVMGKDRRQYWTLNVTRFWF